MDVETLEAELLRVEFADRTVLTGKAAALLATHLMPLIEAHTRARVAQLEGACEAAAEQFDFYAEQHRQKQTPDGDHKEKVNREFAAKMRQALGGSDGR